MITVELMSGLKNLVGAAVYPHSKRRIVREKLVVSNRASAMPVRQSAERWQ
jgi:hypothetical protein